VYDCANDYDPSDNVGDHAHAKQSDYVPFPVVVVEQILQDSDTPSRTWVVDPD
jgi:hypothetical protein